MMAVLALPPKEFCSMRVSLESLYGMCPFLPLLHQAWKLCHDKRANTVKLRKYSKIRGQEEEKKFMSASIEAQAKD